MSSSTSASGAASDRRFPIAYLAASMRARRGGGRWYRDNRFEAEAREAAARRKRA